MRERLSGAVPASITIILGVLTAVGPFSLDAYLPAFPTIAEELDASNQQVQLSLTTCLIGLALGQLVVGPWGDRVGRRLPLLLGPVAYLAASIACALAPNIEFLIIMRFIQGFAGAAGLVTARAVVRDLAQGRAAIVLYSRLAVVSGIAPVIAPVLGAVALAFVSWRGVFVGLAVLGAVITVLVATMLHETHHLEHRTKGGFSATLSAFGSLLRDRAFTGYALVAGLTSIVLFSYISSSSFVAQDVYGATPAQFAATFAANGIGLAALGQLNGRLAPRLGPLFMLKVGVVAQAVGMLLLLLFVLLRLDFGDYSVFAFAVVLFLAIAPLGLLFPNTMAICMGQSAGRSGTASALLGVATFLFGAAASPIAGAGDPAIGMVIVMASASAVMISLVFLLASRVKLVEE